MTVVKKKVKRRSESFQTRFGILLTTLRNETNENHRKPHHPQPTHSRSRRVVLKTHTRCYRVPEIPNGNVPSHVVLFPHPVIVLAPGDYSVALRGLTWRILEFVSRRGRFCCVVRPTQCLERMHCCKVPGFPSGRKSPEIAISFTTFCAS